MSSGLKINTDLCMGCCACEIACKMEHELPEGVRFIVMNQTEDLTPGKEKLIFSFSVCSHCEHPVCMDVCPKNAIAKDERGIVYVKEELCVGCKLCKVTCPDKIPQFGPKGVMQKCDLCKNRLEAGLQPSCVTECPAHAITL